MVDGQVSGCMDGWIDGWILSVNSWLAGGMGWDWIGQIHLIAWCV